MHTVDSRSFETFSGEKFINSKDVQNSNLFQGRILCILCTYYYSAPDTLWRSHGSHSKKWQHPGHLSQPPLSSQCLQNKSLWGSHSSWETKKSHREQDLDCREVEGEFSCPSLSTQYFITLHDSKLSSYTNYIVQTSQLWQLWQAVFSSQGMEWGQRSVSVVSFNQE